MHAPWPYEYATELASALAANAAIDNIRLLVCTDFPLAAVCDAEFEAVYPDPAGHGSRLARLYGHLESVVRVGLRLVRERPDVFHVQAVRQPRLDWTLLVWCRLLSIPVVWTAHNSLPHERRLLDARLYRLIYRLSDAVIVHTRQSAAMLTGELGVSQDRLQLIAHGNLKRLTVARPTKAEARTALSIDADAFVLFFFGRIRAYKGLDVLLAAIEAMPGPRPVLIVAGEDVAGLCRGMAASESLRLDLRHIDDAAAATYFAAADLSVLPYRRIDQSGVLLLAMSYGTPVMASAVGGLAEVIRHDETGFLVPPDDIAAWTAALLRVREDPALRERVQTAVDDVIDNEYGWPLLAEQTAAVYRRVTESVS